MLGRDDIGVHEKFFDVGGTSLTLLALSNRLARLGPREVPLSALFEHSTVEAMARLIANRPTRATPAEKGYQL
ncbi:phosphopantetheine-binding protein [Streptomyces sp. G45]|uniref:phosphopantetheine-binding protein n=1 Tax=Streptomyces sp. G45 TaxID=3406627 RepID=UPI003C15F778